MRSNKWKTKLLLERKGNEEGLEGSLSSSWNEKYNSLQKTHIWKSKNAGSAVEMPFRNSKRSRLFCEEDDRQINTRSPKRNQKVAMVPQKFSTTMSTPEKKVSQKIGLRLRNLLKLPKAHKWCIYEWFYSNIDKCSSAFFEEERSALKQKRQKIRLLQQRKVADLSQFKDLPEEIPLPLVIGTKVTARLRGVHDGLFTGQIDAVDTLNATYRVTFDRAGLGTHTVPDYEVLSNEPHETMPIAAFGQKQRPSRFFMTPPRLPYTPSLQSPITDSDPLLGQSSWKSKLSGTDSETLGGFPVEFLIQVKSYSMPISIEFQRRYATIVLDLEQLNKDLNKVLHKVQQYCYELAPDQGLQPADQPTDLRRRCEEEAQEVVRQANTSSTGQLCVESENLTDLISRLTAILLQIKCLAEGGDLNSFEFKSLTDSLNDIKNSIDSSNIRSGIPTCGLPAAPGTAVQVRRRCQMEQEGNEGISSVVFLALLPPGSDAELEENKTETDCPGVWWVSVSDFPLRRLSMYFEYILRKE
ncbi:Protein lin-9 like protein [Willisornis vidua]|uniref:Protein lin-9 like protein n=1 Tax=Willisornis vidua TaxID=1566151 RepID=A0ABQ9D919_9PASS|nr:Protein lin-9 like protein [Willisornis vidua]